MRKWITSSLFTIGLCAPAYAADHIDSPAAVAEPTADISDLYAWMSPDATKLNLILNVNPFAGDDSDFSTAVQYVFHVNSSSGYGETQTETRIICQFYDASKIECWAGGDYVEGNPSSTSGITSSSGAMRVFAGLRDDPFFMEFQGFTQTVSIVKGAASALTFDVAGCPALDAATGAALRAQLQGGPAPSAGAAPVAATDTFEGAKVLSIVLQLDKALVTTGGPLLGVWASTHAAN